MIPPNTTIILRTQVGSGLHGTAVEGQDDRDEMAIAIAPPQYVIGIDRWEHHIHRDAAEGERSKPGDLDLTIYSIHKWAHLAAKGNPTVLQLLFVPESYYEELTSEGRYLVNHRDVFVSKSVGKSFLGYLRGQRERLVGQRGQKNVKRPELETLYGFDTKYAMHAYRLAIQGIEIMRTGKMTFPMENGSLQIAKDIRTGKYDYEKTLHLIEDAEAELLEAFHESHLPAQSNREDISALITTCYFSVWDAYPKFI